MKSFKNVLNVTERTKTESNKQPNSDKNDLKQEKNVCKCMKYRAEKQEKLQN